MKGSRDQLQNSVETWKLQLCVVKLLFLRVVTVDHNVPGIDRPVDQRHFWELEVNQYFFFNFENSCDFLKLWIQPCVKCSWEI